MRFFSIRMSPPQLLVLLFLSLTVIGTILLKLPIATTTPISWINACFTTVSAFTVTGLGVVDTGTTFTLFGQLVILTLIQVGGLGIMSFAVLIFIVLGKKISWKNRILLQQALNQTNVGGIIRLAKALLIYSIGVELLAMVFLSLEWVPEYGWKKGLYASFFHSISAFNNAGFSIWPDSLIRHAASPLVNLVITSVIILGGIGFTVVVDIWTKRRFSRLSLHSKLMIIFTFIFNLVGMLAIYGLERNNINTLGKLNEGEKILAAYFQSVTTRTAGFDTVDIANLTEPTLLVIILFMFIGAGSASTGGGIKLTTFLVIVLGVIKFLKEQDTIVIFRKAIEDKAIVKAIAITLISIMFSFVAILTLSITEKAPLMQIVFEVFSAFGTVGLTIGLTTALTFTGKCIIIFMMFFGKLGPLTLAFTLARKNVVKIKYPSEDILTG
ncbi:TrkH family potassium uptake protein [Bacillus sp. 165]|uniref:TrkH family potassium uptake protein n=1 Tax=Bacillus sp. 165 TaxID=1529117 RepID=UPI001ADC82A8|nr:TrkH family potassium uptake protein [Bacillus sp. 165]MBO9128467.1 potassium transporter TrkH [Bacillus sp. 165]